MSGNPDLDACAAALPLIAQALAACEKAGFELAAMLLQDAWNILSEDLADERTTELDT